MRVGVIVYWRAGGTFRGAMTMAKLEQWLASHGPMIACVTIEGIAEDR
jgi:hypothetical protein